LFAFAAAFSEKEYETAFTKWMVEFDKSYEPEEFFYRFEIFKNTMDFIEDWNSANHTSTCGLNQFADLTSAEFKLVYLGYKPELARGNASSLLVISVNLHTQALSIGSPREL